MAAAAAVAWVRNERREVGEFIRLSRVTIVMGRMEYDAFEASVTMGRVILIIGSRRMHCIQRGVPCCLSLLSVPF